LGSRDRNTKIGRIIFAFERNNKNWRWDFSGSLVTRLDISRAFIFTMRCDNVNLRHTFGRSSMEAGWTDTNIYFGIAG
jgi:hypothetical protein